MADMKWKEFCEKKTSTVDDIIEWFQQNPSLEFVMLVLDDYRQFMNTLQDDPLEERNINNTTTTTPTKLTTPTKQTKQRGMLALSQRPIKRSSSAAASRRRVSSPASSRNRTTTGSTDDDGRWRLVVTELLAYFLRHHYVPNTLYELQQIVERIERGVGVEWNRRIVSQLDVIFYGLGKSCVEALATKEIDPCFDRLLDEFPSDDVLLQDRNELGGQFAQQSQQQQKKSQLGSKVMVPFREETDSRNHFQTPQLVELYTNRERTRDGFLARLRQFYTHDQHHFTSRRETRRPPPPPTNVLGDLHAANYSWFAQFFVTELVQVGLFPIAERDPEVKASVASSSQDKLQKLHRRFSKKATTGKPASSKASRSVTAPIQQQTEQQPWWGCFKGTTQEFFYHFLRDADSFRLNVHLLRVLTAKVRTLCTSLALTPAGLTEKVLQLKVLARFIAFLTFSPNSRGFSVDEKDTSTNMAVQIELQDAISRANESGSQPPPLNVYELLDLAQRHRQLILTIPWVCEYMTLSLSDPVAQETQCIRNVWEKLADIFSQTTALSCHVTEPSQAMARLAILTQLDTLFVSMKRTVLLSLGKKQQQQQQQDDDDDEDREGLDRIPWIVDSVYIETCCPAIEEFKIALSRSRSVRCSQQQPKTLQPETILRPDREPPQQGGAGIELQVLEHSFFQQHVDLQHIATVVINQVVVNATVQLMGKDEDDFIGPYVDPLLTRVEKLLKRGYSIETIQIEFKPHAREEQERLKQQALQHLTNYCRTSIATILPMMFPPHTCPKVVKVAQALAIRHAISLLPTRCLSKVTQRWRQSVKHGVSRLRKVYRSISLPDDAFTEAATTGSSRTSSRLIVRELSRAFDETADDAEEPQAEEPPADTTANAAPRRAFHALNARLVQTKDVRDVLPRMIPVLDQLLVEAECSSLSCQLATIHALLLDTTTVVESYMVEFLQRSRAFGMARFDPERIQLARSSPDLVALYAQYGIVSVPALERRLLSEATTSGSTSLLGPSECVSILHIVQRYHALTPPGPAYDPMAFATIVAHLAVHAPGIIPGPKPGKRHAVRNWDEIRQQLIHVDLSSSSTPNWATICLVDDASTNRRES